MKKFIAFIILSVVAIFLPYLILAIIWLFSFCSFDISSTCAGSSFVALTWVHYIVLAFPLCLYVFFEVYEIKLA